MSENVNNHEIYLVGGAVRDELMGLKPRERDWVVVGSSPGEMLSMGYKAIGKDFPVYLHPHTKEEYALARTERKTAPGHTGFEFQTSAKTTLVEDLKRRDLTINAIAKTDNGEFIDPYNGRSDIRQKILRHVSCAFSEDPLRVLRVARFKAQFAPLKFSIAEQTLTLMRCITDSGELTALSADRIWKETEKALLTDMPSVYFETLRQCGALKILFPAVDALFGVPQRADYHPEIDSGVHTMMVLDRAAQLTGDISIRFSALTHDLGKALTPVSQLPRHIGHEKRGLIPLAQLFEHYPIPNNIKRIAQLCCEHHLLMHNFYQLRPETIMKLIQKLDGFRRPQHIEQFAILCQADSQGRGGQLNKPYPQAQSFIQLFNEVIAVGASQINDDSLRGPELGKAIKKQRLEKIREFLRHHHN